MWRIKNPTKPAFTWRRQTSRIQSRLDYWYISDFLFDTVTECDILPPVFGSDHSPISITIESLQNCQKGKGYWEINNTFLEEPDYINIINRERIGWLEEIETFTDPRIKWEYLKFKERGTSIKYGKERAKAKHEEKKELEERVKHLQEEVDNSINDTERGNLLTSLNECKNKLQDFLDYRTQGLLLGCKAQYYMEGEKN